MTDTTITLRYSSVDGHTETRKFKTLRGARAYAHKWVGEHAEISTAHQYAVSSDGIGKITFVSGPAAWSIFTLFTDNVQPEAGAVFSEAKVVKLTPVLQEAINYIAHNNGCGANSKTVLKDDNMTWFKGADLMEGLGLSLQSAGGVMHALELKGLIFKTDNQKARTVKGEVVGGSNWVLTDAGIDASDLGAS